MNAYLQRLRSRLDGVELRGLALLLAVSAAVWTFAEIADEVVEGETHVFDERLLLALRTPGDVTDPLGPLWFEEMVRDFTALGSMGVLTFVSLAAFGYLLLSRRAGLALTLFAAVAGGMIASTLLKLGFERPRPDLVPHGTEVMTHSFPSGHSMLSAVVYLTLGALLARAQDRRRLGAYLLTVMTVLTLLVGASRVYLGVHWPTDVLAGWSAGAAWALACWLVATWLQRRGGEDRP